MSALESPDQVNGTLSRVDSASERIAQMARLAYMHDGMPANLTGLRAPTDLLGSGPLDSDVVGEARILLSVASSLLPRRVGLEAFAGLLQAHGVLSGRLSYAAHEGTLQKCAFIAQEGFGLNLGYEYHLHAYGTFSSLIAADFARLARGVARAGASPMPPGFREKEFLSLVSGKGLDWLCVASIVVHERGLCGPGALRRHVERMSASHNRGLVKGAIREIDAALGPARG